jgi:hypothetical protein
MIFARLVAEMPPIEPSTGFVARTVRAACQAHTRRRLVRRVALIAAALLISIAAGSIYELTALATSLIVPSTVVFSHGVVWFLTAASEGARRWWIPERILNSSQ